MHMAQMSVQEHECKNVSRVLSIQACISLASFEHVFTTRHDCNRAVRNRRADKVPTLILWS